MALIHFQVVSCSPAPAPSAAVSSEEESCPGSQVTPWHWVALSGCRQRISRYRHSATVSWHVVMLCFSAGLLFKAETSLSCLPRQPLAKHLPRLAPTNNSSLSCAELCDQLMAGYTAACIGQQRGRWSFTVMMNWLCVIRMCPLPGCACPPYIHWTSPRVGPRPMQAECLTQPASPRWQTGVGRPGDGRHLRGETGGGGSCGGDGEWSVPSTLTATHSPDPQ